MLLDIINCLKIGNDNDGVAPLSELEQIFKHYWNSGLCRVPGALPSAFCRALGKDAFAESRTRQNPALGNDLVYRVQDTRYRNTLGKDIFVECRTLGKDGARQRAVSGRMKMTVVNLC
jgi:hypothetical protein